MIKTDDSRSNVLTVLIYMFPFLDPEVRQWAPQARILHWLTFLWFFIGLGVLFVASYPVAQEEYQDGIYYIKRQILWSMPGMVGFQYIVRSPIQRILNISPWMFLFLLLLILCTHIPGLGAEVYGATRWISVGPITIQPSELIKPFIVLQSAIVFGKWKQLKLSQRIFWLSMFVFLLLAILTQPNLSTTALCGMSLWLIALAAGLPKTQLIAVGMGGILSAVISISIHEYQLKRVLNFLDPWKDPRGNGYQLIQSLLAVGSGGWWGSGLGMSQQKLFYLPIQYTDFIFAVFAEEFGLIGCIFLLLLISVYGSFGIKVADLCTNPVKRLVAVGVVLFMVGQSILNIGVATGVLPTTGLPLPMFSYGGSSIIASLTLAGLVIRVAKENLQAQVINLRE